LRPRTKPAIFAHSRPGHDLLPSPNLRV